MDEWIRKYINKNFDKLLALDYKWAFRLGAPRGLTISGNSYRLEQKGSKWGKILRIAIDAWFRAIQWGPQPHCKNAFEHDVKRMQHEKLS